MVPSTGSCLLGLAGAHNFFFASPHGASRIIAEIAGILENVLGFHPTYINHHLLHRLLSH